MRRALGAILVLASLNALGQTFPALVEVDATGDPELAAKREAILRERKEVDRAAEEHRQRCAAVEPGTDRAEECAYSARVVDALTLRHIARIRQFNSELERLCCRRPAR